MTTLQQHIEALDVDEWAGLTKRSATAALAAAEQLGIAPPTELAAAATMSERELVEHRNRFGPEPQHVPLALQLVEADRLRAAAERQARQAEQDARDADAAAQMARDEAAQSARATEAARERVRAVQAASAHKDAQRSEERAATQQTLEELRGELERAHADHATELAAAHEQVRAAQARAEQRATERAEERATAQHDLEELRGELERAQADHATELAAARGQAEGQIAAARQTAQQEVARARAEAEAAVARAHEEAEEGIAAARQSAQDEIARAQAQAGRVVGSGQPGVVLSVPIPAAQLRAHTGRIEDALAAVREIDYLLEAGAADGGESRQRVDVERVRILVHTVQQQAWELAQELRDLPSRYAVSSQAQAADGYAAAAASVYSEFLQRIAAAAQQLATRDDSRDSEVVDMVTAMLDDHPWRATG